MIITTRSQESARRFVRLFRGEAPEHLESLRRYGVGAREPALGPGFPGLRTLSLLGMPPALVPELGAEVLYEHVIRGSANSPFVSFADDLASARDFAHHGGQRPRGLVIAADIEIVEEYAVEAHPTWRYGCFADSAGRAWIRTDRCNVGADALLRPGLVKRFQELGAQDSEYLVLGGLRADEVKLYWSDRWRRRRLH